MQSFFGNKTGRPAAVSTVTVKKKVVARPLPPAPPRLPSHSSKKSGSSSSSLNSPRPKPSSHDSSSSTHRLKNGSLSSRGSRGPSPTKAGSGHASPARRRKADSMRILPDSDSDDGTATPKRRRVVNSGVTPDIELDVGRKVFCPGQTDERGEWGRGWAGFVTCEEAVRGAVRGWAGGDKGSMETVDGAREKYKAYFLQPGFDEKAEPIPSVELRYPSGAIEKFILLQPKSPREYDPIAELKSALRLILKHYIPPSHAHIFGTLDASGDLDSTVPSRLQTPTSLSTPPPDGASPAPPVYQDTIGDALRRALAPNRRDGPGLIKAMKRLNVALADLQEDGTLASWLTSPEYRITRGDWSSLIDFVHESAYTRVVAPFADQLEHHPKHPEEVAAAISEKEDAYGELRHAFMSKVIEQTGLGPDKVFVDLGSGVGNCVMQAAVQAGCASYGFELLPVPARCARLQLRECQRRWAMWCLDGNLAAEVHEGDFRTHPEVRKRICQADVVLVNNEVFPSSLNLELEHLFLDLKEGATIVSLKPFVPDGWRMNDSNCDSFAAILRASSHPYYMGWVSWKGDSGRYHVQVVDRAKRLKYEETMTRRSTRG